MMSKIEEHEVFIFVVCGGNMSFVIIFYDFFVYVSLHRGIIFYWFVVDNSFFRRSKNIKYDNFYTNNILINNYLFTRR